MKDPGLCGSCLHSRQVRGRRTSFWMCELSKTDATFPRYPRLPVLACAGYARAEFPNHKGASEETPSPDP